MLAVRLLGKSCKYMLKTNSVVYTVMLRNFYTNVFIRIRFYEINSWRNSKKTSAMFSESVF